MFNLSFGELAVLGAIGLIFIGPKQLPQVAKVLGKTINELRKAMNEVKSTMTDEMTKAAKNEKPETSEEPEKIANAETKE